MYKQCLVGKDNYWCAVLKLKSFTTAFSGIKNLNSGYNVLGSCQTLNLSSTACWWKQETNDNL